MEERDEPTPEEIGEVCIQLRRLSPDISINLQVRSAIRSFWHNVPSALARVKTAMVALRVPPLASLLGGASNQRGYSSRHSKTVRGLKGMIQ